jgi:diguanylate cyclase (GGDEF)-like protein
VNVAAQMATNISLVLSTVAVMVAWRREIEIQLERQADTDPLTGLLNRRGWIKQSEMLVAQARRHGHSVGILMIDLDHFKQVNDRYGHEAGDRALMLLGKCMAKAMRESDVCGRLGGEEFALLLPHVNEATATALDSRLRALFQSTTSQQMGITLNFSSGLAFCDVSQPDALKKALMQADASMYQAKANGRGRLCANADVNITVPDELVS